MHVISRKKLREFWADHLDSQAPLNDWFKVASKADWGKFADIRATYRHADQVGRFVVFNIGGNKYRLIVEVLYDAGRVLVRHVLTHREYDTGKWKAR
jgi:mRNA interferase HigB